VLTSFVDLTRLTVAAIFVVAGISKAAQPSYFVESIQAYSLLPRQLRTRAVAYLVITAEIVIACTLISTPNPLVYGVAGSFFAIFVAVGSVELLRGHSPDCGCFGAHAGLRLTWLNVMQNLLITACLGAAAGGTSLSGLHPRVQMPMVLVAVELAALYWFLLYAQSVIVTVDEAIRRRSQ
jgi:uncharacterized membrane protein YphA (DoxX/SURF4 family)